MMKKVRIIFIVFGILLSNPLVAQGTDALIVGGVQPDGEHIPFATIVIEGTTIGITSDQTGHFMLPNMPEGTHIIRAQAIGYKPKTETITILANETKEIKFTLEADQILMDQIVVAGTRTFLK